MCTLNSGFGGTWTSINPILGERFWPQVHETGHMSEYLTEMTLQWNSRRRNAQVGRYLQNRKENCPFQPHAPHLLLTQLLINNCGFEQIYLKNIAFHCKFSKDQLQMQIKMVLPPHFHYYHTLKEYLCSMQAAHVDNCLYLKFLGWRPQEQKRGLPPKLCLCLPGRTV